MFKIIMKIVVFVGLSIGLYAGNGLGQSHLVSVYPSASESGVSANSVVEVKFDLPITAKSVKKHTIVLKQNNKKVYGVTAFVGDDTLRFTPNEPLAEGACRVKVKKVKLQKEKSNDNAQYEPKNGFQRFIYWLCSLFYDNPADCPLCKKICGSGGDTIKTKKIKYTFTVEDSSPKVVKIVLSETNIELNEGNETTLSVTANYDDNTTLDISNDAEWVIGDANIVSVSNGIVKALKEGTTTLQAKYEGKTSDTLNIIVYKEVNGYRLPPEPDETLNNSTLLGIDDNDNGVRDDVERYIIQTYNHPIEVGILMQSARAYNMVIVNPAKAQEVVAYSDNSLSCQFYWIHENNENFHLSRSTNAKMRKELKKLQFNTLQRHMAYERYNTAFHGKVLTSPKASKEKCEFDENGILGDLK